MDQKPKIAVVGAGLAGLYLAQRLSTIAEVTVFEKSRGLGGRMSTRRRDLFHFDHGAQYFTVRSASFRTFLAPFLQSGIVQQWSPRIIAIDPQGQSDESRTSEKYVAVPGMTALCKEMAAGLDVICGRRVETLKRDGEKWTLFFDDACIADGFDWVFSTAPAVQSAGLLPDLTDWSTVKMNGCYTLMLGFEAPVTAPFDAARITGSPIAWIANNADKPGRNDLPAFVCQSHHDWADAHMEDDQQQVQATLSEEFYRMTGINPSHAVYASLHRWRYAKVGVAAQSNYLLDWRTNSGACGDWCIAGRVEAAFQSAHSLADALLHRLKRAVA